MKNKIVVWLIVVAVIFVVGWFLWNFIIPSEDIQKGMKDMRADAVGLNRLITHTLYDGSNKTWECKTKIYSFPTESGGAAFTFIDGDGKKVICGPGWRIEEK